MDALVIPVSISIVIFIMVLLALHPSMRPIKFGVLVLIALILCGVALHHNDRNLTEEQRAVARAYP